MPSQTSKRKRDMQRWARPRRRTLAKTAARGYSGPHTTIRAAAVKAFRPGQPCAIGGEPLWHHTHAKWCDLLDLAHDHVNGGYLGLACRHHNRSEGATRGNQMRGGWQQTMAAVRRVPAATIPRPLRTSRNW